MVNRELKLPYIVPKLANTAGKLASTVGKLANREAKLVNREAKLVNMAAGLLNRVTASGSFAALSGTLGGVFMNPAPQWPGFPAQVFRIRLRFRKTAASPGVTGQ